MFKYKISPDSEQVTLCLNDISAKFIRKGSLANRLLKGEEYEFKELRFLLDNLNEDSIFLDVGASIGYFSILLKLFKPGITVWGFEPCKVIYKICLENLKLNRLTQDNTVSRLALSNYKGKGLLKLHEQDGLNTLGRPFAESKFLNQEEVEVTTLDLFLKSSKDIEQVDIIKADIEGGELRLFQGATKLLTKPDAPLLLFENVPYRTSAFGYLPIHVEGFLQSFGYKIRQISQEMFAAQRGVS